MRSSRFILSSFLFLTLWPLPAAVAGNLIRASESRSDENAAPKNKPPESTTAASEIDQLRLEMQQLHALIEQQQRAMAEMQKRLEAIASAHNREDVGLREVTGGAGDTAEVENEGAAKPLAEGSIVAAQPTSSQPAVQGRNGLVAGWDQDHAFLRSADGAFETNFLGYSQLDNRSYSSGTHPANTFVVRRARLAIEGKLYKYFEFRLEGDFADTTSTPLRDFYVNVHRVDQFQLRFGQTREPYSQEEMRADNLQDFIERSLVNNLVPSRSPGMMAYGTLGRGVFDYQVGVFNGKGILQNNNNGTPDQAARVRFNPFKHTDSFWLKGLIVGGAYNQGRSVNGLSVSGTTESRITFFKPETVNGKVYRSNGEITWLLGPATFRAEYDQTNQRRDNLGVGATNLPGVVSKGYMAQLTYMLTGENKPDGAVLVPRRNLFDERGQRVGLGAWELKIRYDTLQIQDSTRNSNHAGEVYFGANWYMNKFVRYSIDFGIERFGDPARAPNPKDKNFFAILNRIQLQL